MTEKKHCWHKLALPPTETAIRADYVWPVSKYYKIFYTKIDKIFTPQWIQVFNNIDYRLESVLLFYRPEKSVMVNAHIDMYESEGNMYGFPFALNFAIGGEQSQMTWYSGDIIQDVLNAPPVKPCTPETPYKSWPISKLKPIDSVQISNEIVLVNTAVPHAVDMKESIKDRWCISVRLGKKWRQDVTWQEIIEKCKLAGVLVER